MKYFCLIAGLLYFAARADAESCACVAEELGFNIDCDDQATVVNAMNTLLSNGCETDCSSDLCILNYYIIQSHHDYCPEDQVPEPVEDGIHILEGMCTDCSIDRQSDLLLPDCPAVTCDDGSGDQAFQDLLSAGCLDFCGTDACGGLYRILRAVHDGCGADDLSTTAEQGIHEFEEICVLYNCNASPVGDDSKALTCVEDEHAGHGHSEETEPAAAANHVAFSDACGCLLGALVGLVAVIYI